MKKHWTVPQMWTGGECWIIGGGLSFPRQFGIPDTLIQKVENKEEPITAYSDYFKPLHDKHVIGVNIAFMLGPWVSVLYFCDRQFFNVYKDKIEDFHNLKVTCVSGLAAAFPRHHIKFLKRDMAFGLSQKRGEIRWNQNSGAAAINFAVHTGVKRILLLGFDMCNQNGKSHWHSGFQHYMKATDPHSFVRFLRTFPAIAHNAKQRNVEILNVSMDSALDHFQKVKLEEVL